jgi:hypothetical protein
MPASTAVVNTGRAIITSRLIGTATAVPLYVAWGTGTTGVALTDTTLTEPGEARTLGIGTQTTTTTASDTVNITGTVVATGTRTIAEAGLFTAVTSGTLFVRGVLASTIGLTTGDSIAFTFNVQITSAVV